jgi:cytochrome c553
MRHEENPMRRPLGFGLVLAAAILAATPALAADPIEASLTTCWSCHGAEGLPKDPTIPILWGQRAAYIEKQLRDYRSGDRDNQIMSSMAEAVPIRDLPKAAAWIAAKPWPANGVTGDAAPPETIETCKACHGAELMGGQSPEGVAPRLGGQFAEYLADQMDSFARGERANQKAMSELMKSIAPTDRSMIAKYLASLK